MYSTTLHSKKSVAYRLVVPIQPVMQVAPGPHPPTPPSGATTLATTDATALIRRQSNDSSAPKQVSEDCIRRADSRCQLSSSVEPETFNSLIDRIGVGVSFAGGTRIFHEGDPAGSIYKVVGGSVHTCKILSDGRRQIIAIYLPGNFFGLGCANEHTLTAEAVSNTKVLVINKRSLAVASRDAAIERQVLLLMSRELVRLQGRVLLLVKNAQERVGEFILDMENRAAARTYVQLSMRRQDIADYLGLTIETISRILTALQSYGAIEMLSRQGIAICNRSLLKNVMADQNKISAFWSYLRKLPADRRRTRIQGPPAGGPRSTPQQLRRNGRAG